MARAARYTTCTCTHSGAIFKLPMASFASAWNRIELSISLFSRYVTSGSDPNHLPQARLCLLPATPAFTLPKKSCEGRGRHLGVKEKGSSYITYRTSQFRIARMPAGSLVPHDAMASDGDGICAMRTHSKPYTTGSGRLSVPTTCR